MKYLLKILPLLAAFILGALVFRGKPAIPHANCIQHMPEKAISYRVTTYAPVVQRQTFYETNIIHDTIPVKIDSLSVIRDYFSKRYYRDTIVNDSNALIIVSDTVSRNRLISRSLQRKFFTHSYLVSAPIHRKLFLGGGVLAYPDKFGLAVGGIYLDKHERAFGVMIDPLGQGVFLSAYWKISLRKRK